MSTHRQRLEENTTMKLVKEPPLKSANGPVIEMEPELNWQTDFYEIIKLNIQQLNSRIFLDMKMKDFDPEFLKRIGNAKGIDNIRDKDKALVNITKNEIQDNHFDQAYYSASMVNNSDTRDELLRDIINKTMN